MAPGYNFYGRLKIALVHKRVARPARLAQLSVIAAMAGLFVTLLCLPGVDAMAQSGGWTLPWDRPKPRRTPRPEQGPPAGPGYQGSFQRRADVCLRLEQRLVQDSSKGTNSRDLLPKLDEDISRFKGLERSSRRQLRRKNCYDSFLFIKTLKQNRRCQRLARQADDAKDSVRRLKAERKQIVGGSRGNSYQDEIISALARNNCGANYRKEARRRSKAKSPFSSNFWEDNDSTGPAPQSRYGALPFATYRTLCVRLCDGYYFPVSFSTLPNHFQRDSDVCQSKCAAPVDLYYHQNPGESVEQMVSATDRKPYIELDAAWRYRKEYVNGCSCKQAEYLPEGEIREKKAEASGLPADFRSQSFRR